MDSRERLLKALSHEEPDRVPYDLGSTQVTGIAVRAYIELRNYLSLPEEEVEICDHVQQLALPGEDVLELLKVDTRGLYPKTSHNWGVEPEDVGDAWLYRDEWGMLQRMEKGGLYYTIVEHPLSSASSPGDVESYRWPEPDGRWRVEGLREKALKFRSQGKAVVLKGLCAGLFEMGQRLRGPEQFMVDLMLDRRIAEAILDKILELKVKFWEMALGELGDLVDVVMDGDDYGTQTSQLISPQLFREVFKPRLKELIDAIHRAAPGVHLMFHSCGSVRDIIPDLVEIGVRILNPVHIRASGMEPEGLKRDFGDSIVFWGGGADTQEVLPRGRPEEVREHVRRNIEALAPGGGFVFTAVHNVQADVPPENFMAMWEALQEFGTY